MLQKKILSAACLISTAFLPTFAASGATVVGSAYTMTNGAGPNGVLMYNRMSDGTLKGVATFFTNGKGTGAGLGTQGALAVNNTGRFLLVPNAGSNDISVLQ